jgi:two-component system, NtrC family, sensor kinase
LLSLATVVYLERIWFNEVQTRVRLDINSARAAYHNHIEQISAALTGASLVYSSAPRAKGTEEVFAVEPSAAEADLRQPPPSRLAQLPQARRWIDRLRSATAIEIVALLDYRGRVLYRANNPDRYGDSMAENPLVADVLRHGKTASGTVIVSAEALQREGPDLAARARRQTPKSTDPPTQERQRSEGMVVAAAVPLLDADGRVAGILYGGDLLNRRYSLVDAIKREVFADETYEGKEIGSVTIFQGDRRIATNVIAEDGSRAVGTRMSEAVYDEVIRRGGTWSKPAFVVNDWYITAYEPIRDPSQAVIGAVYVGLLRKPFAHAQATVIVRFLLLMIAATAASLVLIYLVTMVVMRPIGRIVEMSRKVIGGDVSARVEIRPPGEMGALCQAVDYMADAIAEREHRMKEALRHQVTRAEKLASIGRLAAGVAHEINNPLTGVLTFSHLMREKPNMDAQDREDLDLIIRETTRAADIVRGLLDFARERPVLMERLDLNEVVRRTVRLIANQKKFEKITIEELLQEGLPEVRGDMNQLQQVLLNLSLNACTAMPGGGTLTIHTAAVDERVTLRVRDTGCGIRPELLDRIFEPFFTTQDVGKGTGLGLSVTHGIIEQHGGELEVQSREGEGSEFRIYLPALPWG